MRSTRSRLCACFSLAAAVLSSACKEATGCEPTDPLCGPGGDGPTVANVTVTSSIDTVVAIGGPQATLTAVARDASSNPVTGLTWNWASLHQTTATVNAVTGVVTAINPGTATIEAEQDNNTLKGAIRIRAVPADLAAVDAALDDAFVLALQGALGTAPQGVVNSVRPACTNGVTSGNVLAIDGCLTSLIAVNGTGTDAVLLQLLDLFYAHAKQQLQL